MPRKTVDSAPLYAFDAQLRAAHGRLCGVDEAGRGPLCGPVCCAAVILDPKDPIPGVTDSKKLSAQRREALYQEIVRRPLAYCVEFVSPQEIDEKNILWATMAGMTRAVTGLAASPDYVLVDGNRCPPDLPVPAQAVIKGDANSASIAAASILAYICIGAVGLPVFANMAAGVQVLTGMTAGFLWAYPLMAALLSAVCRVSSRLALRLAGVLGMILGPIVCLVAINVFRTGIFDGILADVGLAVRDTAALLADRPSRDGEDRL